MRCTDVETELSLPQKAAQVENFQVSSSSQKHQNKTPNMQEMGNTSFTAARQFSKRTERKNVTF